MHHKAARSCSATCIAKHFRSRGSSSTWLPRGEGEEGRLGKGQRVRRVRWPLDGFLIPCKSSLPPATCSIYNARLPTFSRHAPSPSPFWYPPLTRYFVSCSPSVTLSVRRRISGIAWMQEVGNFSVYISCRRVVRVSDAFSLSGDLARARRP